MQIQLVHFYADLMNLYGSYANLSVLKKRLEEMGDSVEVRCILPGEAPGCMDLTRTDFVMMGAGTERAQRAASGYFQGCGEAVKTAAGEGIPMLFAGTSMELLGRTVIDAEGREYKGIGLADFVSRQGRRRIVEDVYGSTALFDAPVVGFMNKCTVLEGIATPFLNRLERGYGNHGSGTPEGFLWKNVIGSHLTGPILVKNPRLLDWVVERIYLHRGQPLPDVMPRSRWAEQAYEVTCRQLSVR